MKISTMRFIIEVSKWKSINKASKHLYINQQQLSRMIATMESDLEVEIFYRNTKGIFLIYCTHRSGQLKKREFISNRC